MIGLDTNVLARYYIDDEGDKQAQRQREAARRLIDSGQPLMVCKTVLLEFEWVMRGFYGFSTAQVRTVMNHLVALPHLELEDKSTVIQALAHCAAGIALADALHLASYRQCTNMASFDDKKFARRAAALNLSPSVKVPV